MRENQETLAARRGTTLVKSLRQKQSAEEKKWYMFLIKNDHGFTQEQAEHIKHTFALLKTASTASRTAVPPRSGDEANALITEEEDKPLQLGVPSAKQRADFGASSSAQDRRRGTKRPASSHSEEIADRTAADSSAIGKALPQDAASAVALPSSEEAQTSRTSKASAVPPRTGNTRAAASSSAEGSALGGTTSEAPTAIASSSAQASNAKHGTKRSASDLTQENVDTTASGSTRGESIHAKEGTASGAKILPTKRKSAASTSTASGATPPTRRSKVGDAHETAQTNKPSLSLEEWVELHEFDAWLETPEAVRIRNTRIETDRQILKNLMVQPPTTATLQSAGLGLEVNRNYHSLVVWHYRCFH